MTLDRSLYIFLDLKCICVSCELVWNEVISSLKVRLIRMIELLVDLSLASHLRFDSDFMSLTGVFINYFSGDASEEVVDFRPLLACNVKFVLHWICIHDIGEYSELLVFIKVLKRIHKDFTVFIYHDCIDILVLIIALGRISEEQSHPTPLVLQLLKADQGEVKPDVGTHLPDLEIIARGYPRDEGYP